MGARKGQMHPRIWEGLTWKADKPDSKDQALVFIEHKKTPYEKGKRKLQYGILTSYVLKDGGLSDDSKRLVRSFVLAGKINELKKIQGSDGKSAYDFIFDASKLLGIKPSAIIALMLCENEGFNPFIESKRRNLVPNSPKKEKDSDKGMTQISDTNRISLNEPGFISALSSHLDMEKLKGLGGIFGISYLGDDKRELAAQIIRKITGYDEFTGSVSKSMGFDVKSNIFAGALYLTLNLKEFNDSYILAAFSYNAGRRRLNNFLEGEKTKNPDVQKAAETNGMRYAKNFWNNFSVLEAYFSERNDKIGLLAAANECFLSVK